MKCQEQVIEYAHIPEIYSWQGLTWNPRFSPIACIQGLVEILHYGFNLGHIGMYLLGDGQFYRQRCPAVKFCGNGNGSFPLEQGVICLEGQDYVIVVFGGEGLWEAWIQFLFLDGNPGLCIVINGYANFGDRIVGKRESSFFIGNRYCNRPDGWPRKQFIQTARDTGIRQTLGREFG